MKVRKFTAKSYSNALKMVKQSMGDDAVILSNRLVAPELGEEHLGPSVELAAAAGEGSAALIQEIPRLRRQAHHGLASEPRSSAGCPDILKAHRRRLLEEEVRERLVDRIVDGVCGRMRQLGPRGQARALHFLLLELMERIPLLTEQPRQRRRFTCVVGTSGVGKSTLLAKMAVVASLKGGQKVAIVGLGRRGAARESLSLAAGVIECPLKEAMTARGLSKVLEDLMAYDHVFLDAPGISPFDDAGLRRLKAMLEMAPGVEIHLVLCAGSRDIEILKAFDAFGGLGVKALAFTKMDENSCFGGILNAVESCRLPLSFFGFGREIPADIERATKERVVDLLLDLSA